MTKGIMLIFTILVGSALISCGGGGGGDGNSGSETPFLTAIAITPQNASLAPGQTVQFSVSGVYSDGTTKEIGSSVVWSSSATSVVTITASGLATAVGTGTATITALSGTVSESVSITVRDIIAESPFGFHPAKVEKPGYADNGYNAANDVGIRWARQGIYAFWFLIQPDLSRPVYDFTLHDRQWREVPPDMRILANIAPQGPLDEGYCQPGSYLPVDTAAYDAFVKAVVERYDGDGIDDMPGLTNPIKHWQVGNEPSVLQKTGFAELQKITYTAIKESCPDCTVLIGGATGFPPASTYISDFDIHFKPILDELAGKYVDVMDYHWYGNAAGDYHGAKDAYDHIRSVLSSAGFPVIAVWITEMGSYSGDPVRVLQGPLDFPLQTEAQQAIDYLKRFVYPLSFGVKKIFPAFGLMEGFKYDGGYFDFTGLIYDGWGPYDQGLGVKKLSYYTYKKMTEKLEGAEWNRIEPLRDSDGIIVIKFMKGGKPVWLVWDDQNIVCITTPCGRQVTITGVNTGTVNVTYAIPSASSGKDVVDYATAFQTETATVSNGTVTLLIGSIPVFVEEQ